jgi:hypothetical protein
VKALLTALLACFGTSVAFAQVKPCEWYRFENDEGVVVLAYSIPPSLVHKGYACIDKDGAIVKVVERELTPDEVAKRDGEIAKRKAEEAAGVARARKDQELTKLYASPRDVEEARDRKVLSIETAIATTKSNIERLKVQKQRLEEQAADREREGLAPSPDILDNLKNLEIQISDKEREVAARKTEKAQVMDQFALDLDRIKLLYGVPADTAAKGATAPAKEAAKNEVLPGNVTAKSDALH